MCLLLAYGTRPEYIKLKSLIHELDMNNYPYKLLFTGQHSDIAAFPYDYCISITNLGFNRLDMIVQSIMDKFTFFNKENDITHVLVQGDTTSAFAVALSAFHHGIKVIHLEAGLRTYDKKNPYPEEVNRRLISEIADIHLCPTKQSMINLRNEEAQGEIFVVGNTVIDNLLPYKDMCEYSYKILVTMHRRENHERMSEWFTEINKLAIEYPEFEFILPLHPNPNVQKHKDLLTHVNIIDPLPYEKMLELLVKVRLVITDSGGLQEECSFFNKKCLVCRTITERPESIERSSWLVKSPDMLSSMFFDQYDTYDIDFICPFGDGHAAEKIMTIIKASV